MVKPAAFYFAEYLILCDSLHYLINSFGLVLFSCQHFTSIFSSDYFAIRPGDTVCLITEKMEDKNMSLSTPGGIFITSNAFETYNGSRLGTSGPSNT